MTVTPLFCPRNPRAQWTRHWVAAIQARQALADAISEDDREEYRYLHLWEMQQANFHRAAGLLP